jgi:hypothetical protein
VRSPTRFGVRQTSISPGGATAILFGWRASTVDVDLCVVPERDAVFRAIPDLKASPGATRDNMRDEVLISLSGEAGVGRLTAHSRRAIDTVLCWA